MKAYICLFAAIILEIISTSALTASAQFTKLVPSLITVIGYILTFYIFSHATKSIPIGIAYAIWSAVGIVLMLIVGAILFKQAPDMPAILGMTLIISGVIIINVFSKMEVH